MLNIEPIELRVMQMLLAGDHPILETLRLQFRHSRVVDRRFTGVGFFTSFEILQRIPKIDPPRRIVLGDVGADVDRLQHGCGFILFIEDGLLSTLECHLWDDESLPENARYRQLYYLHKRDLYHVEKTTERDMVTVNAILTR